MLVRATQFGFYKQKRKPGDIFEFEGKPSVNWMEPVDEAAQAAWKKAKLKVPPKFGLSAENSGNAGASSDQDSAAGAGSQAAGQDVAGGQGSTGDQSVI